MPKFNNYPDSTVLVGDWQSRCNNCGEYTLPSDTHHTKVSGYSGGAPGCGIKFTHIAPDAAMRYLGDGHDAERVQDCNPDLELIWS